MLSDFFRINLPYGIAKNEKGEWMAFNREYLPIGYTDESFKNNLGTAYLDLPIYTKYKNVSGELLKELAHSKDNGIHLDDKGSVEKVFFYNDSTNPVNQNPERQELWDDYFLKLKKLSMLRT